MAPTADKSSLSIERKLWAPAWRAKTATSPEEGPRKRRHRLPRQLRAGSECCPLCLLGYPQDPEQSLAGLRTRVMSSPPGAGKGWKDEALPGVFVRHNRDTCLLRNRLNSSYGASAGLWLIVSLFEKWACSFLGRVSINR